MSATDPATARDFTRGPAQFHSDRARPELLEQRRPGDHVWSSFVVHVLSDRTVAAVLAERTNVIMDGENVAMIMIGCYVCEEPLTKRAFHRRCTGEQRP